MAHDQQAGGPPDAKPDARVAGAVTHWGYRFTANGTDYADFTATLARITRWVDWCREWGVTATGYEQVAEAAEDAGERQAAAEYFLTRGLATLAVDGPGQGEAEYELPIEPGYEKVATAVVDFLQDRAGLDVDKIGLFGVSLGGYYAARAAAYEKRLRAVVALAGPYRLDLDWDERPPQTRATFQARSGARSAAEARAKAAELTLEAAAPHIETPLLVVGGARDTIAPAYHQERLAEEVRTAELVLYPDGNHGVTNRAYESRSRMADWLAARLSF
jgi:dipeptidyl aminopeptidase/acylaminoacyl peptidase